MIQYLYTNYLKRELENNDSIVLDKEDFFSNRLSILNKDLNVEIVIFYNSTTQEFVIITNKKILKIYKLMEFAKDYILQTIFE